MQGNNVLRWIIGKVEKQADILHGTIFFKVLLEETCCFHVDLERVQRTFRQFLYLNYSVLPVHLIALRKGKGNWKK